jgi:hypothetical protein
MFTILIPCLKRGYLASQLHFLSKQVYKDFTVLVMDGYYKEHAGQAFMQKQYPFQLIHVPLVDNPLLAKRYDYSIKNNLAMLSPTFHFVFISDTHFMEQSFTQEVYKFIVSGNGCIGSFPSFNLESACLDTSNHTLLTCGAVPGEVSDSAFICDKKDFIYLLNGFDEVLSVSCKNDTLLKRFNQIAPFHNIQSVYHVEHPKTPYAWNKKSCEHCQAFEEKAVKYAKDYQGFMGNLRLDVDAEAVEQMIYFDKDLGCMMFQCGVCGFGGPVSLKEYEDVKESFCRAPDSALDGRAGRDLIKVYEVMTTKCSNAMESKLAYLRGSY